TGFSHAKPKNRKTDSKIDRSILYTVGVAACHDIERYSCKLNLREGVIRLISAEIHTLLRAIDMIQALRKLYQLPSFATPQEDRQATILNSILWLALMASTSRLVIIALDPAESIFDAVGERFGGVVLLLICVIILKRGYLTASTAALLIGTILSTALVAANLGNMAGDPFYILVSTIVVSGLIAGPRGVVYTGLSAIALTFFVTFLYRAQIVPSKALVLEPSIGSGLSLSILFATLTYLLFLAARSLDHLLNKLTRVNRSLYTEITERERATEALRHSENELAMTLESAPIGILTFDLDGNILRVNRTLCAILEYSKPTLLHQRIQDLIETRDLPAFSDRVKKLKEGMIFEEPLEQEFQSASGKRLKTNLHVALIRNSDGAPLHIVASLEDVTMRRRVQQQMELAQRQEGIGVLAGGIAHDFNNLLVSMLGQGSLATERLEMGKPVDANIRKIVTAAEKAALLTKQLLAYAGKGQVEMHVLSLNALLDDNRELLGITLPKQVQLVTQLAPELPAMVGDLGQMQQVVMNLLINAGQAMPSRGGIIRVKTDLLQMGAKALAAWNMGKTQMPAGHYVMLEVSDNGHGMDAATVKRIFDPFFTTKSSGHGLGLAAVLGIVRSHGGSLRVRSELGKGTVFKMIFPASTKALPKLDKLPKLPENHTLPNDKSLILAIDDEVSVCETVADMLDMSGYSVVTAFSGQAGIETFKKHQGQIKVVLLDLTMPGLSGEETFRQLRTIDPNIHIVISSGHSQTQASAAFAGETRIEFLPKPYDFQKLERVVRKCLSYAEPYM
ncbi:MAG: ATP-binding protein, partial [Candidatus Promineifilaceae bacterium]